MNQITIEYPRGLMPKPFFHCPACGAETIDPEGADIGVCDHLLYAFHCSIPDFLHKHPDYEAVFAEVEAECLAGAVADGDEDPETPDDEIIEAILKRIDSRFSTIFGVSWTISGMGCGPVSTTMLLGYRLADEPLVLQASSEDHGSLS